MKLATLHTKVLPSLLSGTSRRPLPGGLTHPTDSTSDSALGVLSLMAQALSFERPLPPPSFVSEPEIADERKIVADGLRRSVVRLLAARNATDHPARALARAFDQQRLRPHPFDLPLIEAFVRIYAEKLGTTAQHWADRHKSDYATQSYFDPELINENNWAQASPSRSAAFLEGRRREDANGARALLESKWGQLDADARFRLLQVLQTGLNMSDHTFLSTLEKDRAPRVRAVASRLLARLGAGGENPALRACLERIQQSQSGLLRKRKVLQLELPANVNDQAASRWILETFADISFGELARAFELSEEQLIEASTKNEPLLLALAVIATVGGRLDLLELIVARLPNAWERIVESGLDTLGTMTVLERQRWLEIIVHPYRNDLPTTFYLWDWLHRIADTEVATSVMSTVLQTRLLTMVPERELGNAAWFELIAAICPTAQRTELRQQLTTFDQSLTVTALALLDILDEMEKDFTHV